MKLIDNVEVSNHKEVVISHKVFYVRDGLDWVRDDDRSYPSSVEHNVMPDCMSANEMASYTREFVGRKRWKIVLSNGTINIFKKGSKAPKIQEIKIISNPEKRTKKNK